MSTAGGWCYIRLNIHLRREEKHPQLTIRNLVIVVTPEGSRGEPFGQTAVLRSRACKAR